MIEPATASVLVLTGIALVAEARCALRRTKRLAFGQGKGNRITKKHKRGNQ